MEEKELLEQIAKACGTATSAAIEPLKADLIGVRKDLGEQVAALAARVEKAEAGIDEKVAGVKRDLEERHVGSQVLDFGNGMTRKVASFNYVREKSLGDKPYSIGNIVRAIAMKDEAQATLEMHVSKELLAVGFSQLKSTVITGRYYLVPLDFDSMFMPVSEGAEGQRSDNLRKLLTDCLPNFADPHEVSKMMRYSGRRYATTYGKTMDPADATAGGAYMPYPERGTLIELMRASTVLGAAGAQQIGLPPGGLDYPKEKGQATFRRTGANQTTKTDNQYATGTVKLTPHEISGIIKLPNSLIAFSNPAVEAVIRRALVADLGVSQETDYLNGDGGTGTPLGLYRWPISDASDVPQQDRVTLHNSLVQGTNGNTFHPNDPGIMSALIEESPDPEGPSGWIMRPMMFTRISQRRADAIITGDGAGPYLFPVTRGALSGAPERVLEGHPVFTTTLVPNNRIKAGGTGLTNITLGNFRRTVIGRVGVLAIATSVDAGFAENQTWFRVVAYDDFALLRPESISVSDQLVIA